MKIFFKPTSTKIKRGFTIIEVLIAITVIVLISGATAVLMAQSVKTENANLAGAEVALVAQSAVDCFESADNSDEFLALLKKVDSFYLNSEAENEENYVFELKNKRYSIEIFCKKDYNSFSFRARGSSGKLILDFSYPSA